jgi:hypothetical protein
MAINQVSRKKQQKLLKFSEFVTKAHGKDGAKLLPEEVTDPSSAFCGILDGDSPYQDRTAVMDLFYKHCLDSCEDGSRVLVTALRRGN